MSEVLREYWPVLLVIVILGLLIGLWVLRPRQRVALSDSAPVRPHMAARTGNDEGGLADEAATATRDVVGELLATRVQATLAAASGGPPDDLQRLKGVGPRLAALLNERGIARYEQLAGLSDTELDLVDSSLGSFEGRLRRDRVREQADYLARGDTDAYEREFGKL